MIKSALQSSLTNDIKYDSMSVGNLPSNEYLIQTRILDTTTASVEFDVTGLGSQFRHLQLVVVARGTLDSQILSMRLNGDTGSVYANHGLTGEVQSSTRAVRSFASTSSTSISRVGHQAHSSAGAGIFAASIIDILDFASSNKTKTIRSLSGQVRPSDESVALFSGLYNSTSPITSITIFREGSNLAIGSRLSLYGVTA
jgi:hypothetical protein